MHRCGIVALHQMGLVAIADEQAVQLLRPDARQDSGIGDLVAVQMQDRQDRAIGHGIEEFVAVPGCRQRSGLGLAVADHGGDDEIGIVEGGAIGMGEGIAQLAPLMDGARGLGRDMAGDAAGKAELLEEPLHPPLVLRDARIGLAIGSLEPGIGDHARAAMAGTGDIDHVQVARLDGPVHMHIDEIQAGGRAPMAEQPRLDVLEGQRLLQQRIVEQIDLPDREIVRRPPPGIHQAELVLRERISGGRRFAGGHGSSSHGDGDGPTMHKICYRAVHAARKPSLA